jgi:hypothetical protein
MKTKHTPGPWNVTKPNGIHAVIRTNDREQTVIAHVQYDRDASLIAAGPELLQALHGAVSCLERLIEKHDENFRPYSDALDIARAAIQKAQGEA